MLYLQNSHRCLDIIIIAVVVVPVVWQTPKKQQCVERERGVKIFFDAHTKLRAVHGVNF